MRPCAVFWNFPKLSHTRKQRGRRRGEAKGVLIGEESGGAFANLVFIGGVFFK